MGYVREPPHRKVNPAWMCQRNSRDKNEASTGYVRETAQIKMKPAWDV